MSRRNDIATTAAMKIGRRLVMRSVRSVTIARPVSDTLASVPSTAAGSTSERRWWTSSSVRASCGAVVGLAVSTAVSPAALNTGAVTAATPGSACRASWMRSTAAWSAGAGTSTTTWIGPLKPGPNPSASWSKAMRWVVSTGALPSSGTPIRMLSAGMARAQRVPRPMRA